MNEQDATTDQQSALEQLGTALQELTTTAEAAEQEAVKQKIAHDEEVLTQLGTALEQLPPLPEGPPPQPKTFMEIAGYKETKFSNMLAFYMDPEEEHGLGDLLPQALLECVERDEFGTLSSENIHTEYHTKKGNRIDIVAEYDDLIIGIENKLWSAVHNDLDDYGRALDQLAGGGEPGTEDPPSEETPDEESTEEEGYPPYEEEASDKREVVKILLAVDKKDTWAGFEAVTYAELFAKVKPRLAEHIHLPSKYITYLVDMFFTLCKPKPNPMERYKKHQPLIQFMEKHEDLLEKAKKMEEELRKEMSNHVSMFSSNNPLETQPYYKEIDSILAKEKRRLGWWTHKKQVLCYDHYPLEADQGGRYNAPYKDHVIWIEVTPRAYHGWDVLLLGKTSKKKNFWVEYNEKLCASPGAATVKNGIFPHDKLEQACARGLEVFLEALRIIDEESE